MAKQLKPVMLPSVLVEQMKNTFKLLGWSVLMCCRNQVNMIKVAKDQIEPVAKLLTECFIGDPLVIIQTKGIPNEKEFLEKMFLLQLNVLEKTTDVFSLDDKFKSVLIGYEKKKFIILLKQFILTIQLYVKIRRLVEKKIIKTYGNNLRDVSKVIDLKWQNQFIKKNYYRINIIAIAQEERGRGVFRELIMPIIDQCNQRNIPIILETIDPRHIAIYNHFGFDLVKTKSNSDIGLSQYCFIRYPNPQI